MTQINVNNQVKPTPYVLPDYWLIKDKTSIAAGIICALLGAILVAVASNNGTPSLLNGDSWHTDMLLNTIVINSLIGSVFASVFWIMSCSPIFTNIHWTSKQEIRRVAIIFSSTIGSIVIPILAIGAIAIVIGAIVGLIFLAALLGAASK